MENKVVGVIIAVMVSVALIGGILVPIVTNATAASDTFINDGYFDMVVYDAEDNVTLTWSFDNPRQLIINDEIVNVPEIDDVIGSSSVVMTTVSATRLTHNSTSISFYGNGTYVTGNETNPSFTLTYVGGTLTATNGTATKEITGVEELVCIANDGPLTMKKYGEPVYIKDDSSIYANGLTYFSGQVLQYSIWGTFANPSHTELSSSFAVTDFSKNYTVADDHVGLYVLDDFTFNASYNNGAPKEVTYSTFAVTKEISADRTDPMDPAAAGILAAVPIIVIVSLLAMIAAVLIRTRY